jgi:hypothetical protein
MTWAPPIKILMTINNPLLFLFLGATLLWSSCETDFQLEGDWKDIPVVYSFLSVQDTAFYIRVERAFLEPGGNAREIAQIPDSIYYDINDVTVKLERLSDGATAVLERVDGRNEGYPREEGDFVNEPNYLYKLKPSQLPLNEGSSFRVIIEREGEEPATASSVLISEIEVASLPTSGFFNFGDYSKDTRFGFRPSNEEGRIFDIRMIFKYRETDAANPGNFISKEAEWIVANNITRDNSVSAQSVTVDNEAFYQFLASELEPISTGNRKFDGIYIQVTAAGVEIEEYLQIANANIGITSAQSIPVYSNVENGVGIVSSRYQVLSNQFTLSSQSRDSLYNSQLTKNLRFVP